MSPPFEFGIQSYCFRTFPENAIVAQKVKALGLSQIELCSVHADFGRPEAFAEITAIYRQAGVSIVSLGVQTFTGQDYEERWFQCARIAGARHISAHFQIDSYLRAIPRVREWSRHYGIQVGIHCHGGYMFGGQPDVLTHLLALGAPEVGLVIDTAWAMQIGPEHGNPVAWANRFAGRITSVHLKDFVFNRDGSWKEAIIGTGNLNLPEFLGALHAGGFNGITVLEYEGDAHDPSPAIGRCIDSIRTSQRPATSAKPTNVA